MASKTRTADFTHAKRTPTFPHHHQPNRARRVTYKARLPCWCTWMTNVRRNRQSLVSYDKAGNEESEIEPVQPDKMDCMFHPEQSHDPSFHARQLLTSSFPDVERPSQETAPDSPASSLNLFENVQNSKHHNASSVRPTSHPRYLIPFARLCSLDYPDHRQSQSPDESVYTYAPILLPDGN